MKLNPLKRTPTVPIAEKPWRQFAINSAKRISNQSQAMLQDHPTLRRNSLIISTLVLVLSRIGIAHGSALNAKGTPDETHRKKEAIKTTIRELCGWTLGYVVFRAIENATKAYLQNALNFRTNQNSILVRLGQELRDDFAKARKKTIQPLGKLAVPLNQEFTLLNRTTQKGASDVRLSDKAAKEALQGWRFNGLVDRMFNRFGKGSMTPLQKLSSLYTTLPLVIGGIPAVIL